MSVNCVDKDTEKQLIARLKAYGANGAPLKVVAAECGINWGMLTHFMESASKVGMITSTHRKLEAWLDAHDEFMPGEYARCSRCGKVKPLDDFNKDKRKPNGHGSYCAECNKAKLKEYRRKQKMANNNTEKAITVDIVKQVKAEDNKEVAAAMLAPYFGITAAQLEAIRAGKWDSLLYKKEPPKPATDVKNAVEALRVEIAEIHSAINRIMAELGCGEEKKGE